MNSTIQIPFIPQVMQLFIPPTTTTGNANKGYADKEL